MGGGQGPHLHERAGSWKEGRSGTQGNGSGERTSASRHGGGLGRVHPHDRVPGFPSRIGRVAPGGTGAGAGLLLVALSPSSPAPDKGTARQFAALLGTWSTWSAVINLTSRAGELRSAPSGPDDRDRVTGKRALALGGARSQGKGHKVNTGLRGLVLRFGWARLAFFFFRA